MHIFSLGIVLSVMSATAHAQSGKPFSAPVPTSTQVPTSSRAVSLRALLQLGSDQDARLNRLYDEYAARRAEQEARFASRQTGQSSSNADQLRLEQMQAQAKIADALLSKRKQALQILGPVGRSQLEAFSQDPRFELQRDRLYQLLLLPVENLGQAPLDFQPRNHSRASLSNRARRSGATGSYGVYGGYSLGGPSYGVYGNVGRGNVGVNVGIGNRGPTIGIGIGRVFGGRRF